MMNERIQELKKQSYFYDVPNDSSIFEYEKFAHLIVRECAGIYEKIDNGNLHMGTDNYLEALRKHFGM